MGKCSAEASLRIEAVIALQPANKSSSHQIPGSTTTPIRRERVSPADSYILVGRCRRDSV